MTASTLSPSKTLAATELVADLQPVAPALTFERYEQLVLLAQKHCGGKPSRALGDVRDELLCRLFEGASGDEDIALYHEVRLAYRVALIGERLRQTCGMAQATSSDLFAIAMEVAQIATVDG